MNHLAHPVQALWLSFCYRLPASISSLVHQAHSSAHRRQSQANKIRPLQPTFGHSSHRLRPLQPTVMTSNVTERKWGKNTWEKSEKDGAYKKWTAPEVKWLVEDSSWSKWHKKGETSTDHNPQRGKPLGKASGSSSWRGENSKESDPWAGKSMNKSS